MIELGPASADDMVLAFLQAEVESPRYRHYLARAAQRLGVDVRSLVSSADIHDAQQNAERRALLGLFRGYERNTLLFPGFPADVSWRWVSVTPTEIAQFKYANWPDWSQLTRGTRLVADGVRNHNTVRIGAEAHVHVPAVATKVSSGETLAPLIAVEGGGDVVMIEGHTRATAYVLANAPAAMDIILGKSANIRQWKLY